MKNSLKSELGKNNKEAHENAKIALNALKGVDIRTMTNKQKENLLIIVLHLLGLADKEGIMK